MAPTIFLPVGLGPISDVAVGTSVYKRQATTNRPSTNNWRAAATDEDLVIESWSQGFVVGALLIMACITIANMRRGILLHKLILIELLLAMSHGTFCFMTFNGYGWYLSATASLLYLSWIVHNVVSWLKVRPFFSHPGGFFSTTVSLWVKRIYLGTLAFSVPIIIFQISDNFRFFNNRGGWYVRIRPYEPLMRDPWWVFTGLTLFHVIRKCYGTGVIELVRRSPRFGILLSAICLSIVFTACDIAASISGSKIVGSTEGINPWWKLSLVFKCLTDTIMLDDFKTELKHLGIKRIVKEEKRRNTISLVTDQHPLEDHESDHDERSSGTLGRHSIQWYRSGQSPHSFTACDISPTTSIQRRTDSSNRDHKNGGQKSLHNPDAAMEELEFSTALALDPSRLSGVESVENSPHHPARGSEERHQHERDSITSHTKRISRLPSLDSWRFEAIKPGKKSYWSNAKLRPDSAAREGSKVIGHGKQKCIAQSPGSDDLTMTNGAHSRVPDHKANDLETGRLSNSEDFADDDLVRRFKKSIGA